MRTETASTQQPEAEPARISGLRQLLVGIILLVGTATSLTLAVLQWTIARGLPDLVNQNVLAVPRRVWTLRITLGVAALTAVGCLVWSLVKKPLPSAAVLHWGKLLSPLLVVGFLPPLFVRGAWAGPAELQFLIILGVAGLVLERLLGMALGELPPAPARFFQTARGKRVLRWLSYAPSVLVCTAVLYYALLISHYTMISHFRLDTSTADLGEYDNQFFNSLHGHPFRLPASEGDLRDWSALKFHADFIIYFLLPFYAIKPGPEVLLIIQSVVIALTAIPIYLFGERRLPRWIAAVVALAFLLLPVVERPNFYDFHAVPIGMFFMAWTIWSVDHIIHDARPFKRYYVFFWLAFVLALASREDVAFGMVIVSLFLLVYGKKPKLVSIMLVLSAAYFVAIKFVVMPWIGMSWYDSVYADIKASGFERYGAVVVTMLTNPVFILRSMLTEAKLTYLLHMLVPLLFLWVRRPYLWVAALPSFFFTLMVTNRPAMFQTSFQYTYQWFPYIVVASILALEQIGSARARAKQLQAAAALALGLVAVGAGYQYGVLLGGKTILGGFGEKRLELSQSELDRYRDLRRLTAQIPPDASVAATSNEGPHVSTRLLFYNLGNGLGGKPDYVLLNRSLGQAEARMVLTAVEAGEYGLLDQRGSFVLMRRGHDTANNAGVIALLRRR